MSSPVELPVRPRGTMGALHAAPWWLLGLALVLAPHPLTLIAALAPLGIGTAVCFEQIRPRGHTVTAVVLDGRGLGLRTRDGQWREARLHPASRIGADWLWLRLDADTRQYSLVLSDRPGFRNTDADALRRFRTRLRLMHTGRQTT